MSGSSRSRPRSRPLGRPLSRPLSRPKVGAASEGGAASVLVVALTGLLMLLGLSAAFVIATVSAHRRVQAAADLAALAGATTAQPGGVDPSVVRGDPCEAAARIAAGNGARISNCRLLRGDVVVTTVLDGPRFLGQSWELTGRARAGPG